MIQPIAKQQFDSNSADQCFDRFLWNKWKSSHMVTKLQGVKKFLLLKKLNFFRSNYEKNRLKIF